MSPLLVVLDIDETLIHATTRDDRGTPDFVIEGWKVLKRPHVDPFLEYCLENYDVGVWTSAGETYAELIMKQLACLSSFRFIWSREKCTTKFDTETYEYHPTKKLKKLLGRGWSNERIIAIDDSPNKWESSYGTFWRYHLLRETSKIQSWSSFVSIWR